MTKQELKQAKVHFRLEKDADGYPPAEVESVWADDLGNGKYRIENTPFYFYNISWQDVVSAEERDGELWYMSTVLPSDHSTVRIFFFDKCSEEQRAEALRFLNENGCTYEGYAKDYPLFAVDVPAEVDYAKVLAHLREHEDELWGVEESARRHRVVVTSNKAPSQPSRTKKP